MIETDFKVLSPDATLGDLVQGISRSKRDLFPIVHEDGTIAGMIKINDIRDIMFKQERYETTFLKDLMYMPQHYISPDDSMHVVVEKFESSGRYNLAVIDEAGKYIGFISRANVFSIYRKNVRHFSQD